MKRLLFSLGIVTAIAGGAIGLTGAFFSDAEKSTGNTFQAGAIDLKIDNTSYYNGVANPATSWTLKDLTTVDKFFDFHDIKPGDWGEDTISVHVDNNDAWACYNLAVTKNADNGCTTPEKIDDPTCDPASTNNFDGELAQNVNFVFWADDGDNILETDEKVLAQGPISTAIPLLQGTLADSVVNNVGGSNGQPLTGGRTYFIGKAWCFGSLGLAPKPQDGTNTGNPSGDITHSGITCNGSGLNNATQTDIVMGDVTFSAIQARNNGQFVCGGPTPTPGVSTTPSPAPSATPTPSACLGQADFMLSLDRSGSIDSGELASLKTAANAFVTTLGPSVAGIHMGEDSFATTATLDVQLTDNATTLHTAINALVAGGFTNLSDSLLQVKNELASSRDRIDSTSKDYVVVITDGNPNRPPPDATARTAATTQANVIKSGGGTIFVVGVGSDVDATYLKSIATDASHYFPVANYTDLSTALNTISHACN